MMLLAFSLSLTLLLAIGPAIGITIEEPLEQSWNSSQNNLTVSHLSTSKSDPIHIPNSVTSYDSAALTTTNISTGDPVYDQFDYYIINATNQYGITDKMMVKAMILQESSFDIFAVSPDIPCGAPDGWKKQESKSFGLMQVTPACIDPDGGRPNLTKDMNSSNWATSWFNPEYNIKRGVKSLADNLLLMKSKFSGCSDEQYMSMALGAYNSGEGAIHGCGEWNHRADRYITSVTHHHRDLSQMANNLNE
jgi:soluble lytic murein transglycosylase-like protein